MNQQQRHEHFIVKFYNEMVGNDNITCISQIPPRPLMMLSRLEYFEIVRPFIVDDISKGKSRQFASIKYGVTESYARTCGEKFSFLPRVQPINGD